MSRRAFLLRFDDITPTSNWAVIDAVFERCDAHGVKPLLAVVPDNKDPRLVVQDARADFWDLLSRRHEDGWAIGLHGLHHVYETTDAGIIGVNPRSEWAGVAPATQRARMHAALDIFAKHGIRPDAWVAPAHSFDDATCRVLREAGITAISDGYFPAPSIDRHGLRWIPCQSGSLQPWPWGLWSVAMHLDAWNRSDIADFDRLLGKHAHEMIAWSDAITWHQSIPWWLAHGVCAPVARSARWLSHGLRRASNSIRRSAPSERP